MLAFRSSRYARRRYPLLLRPPASRRQDFASRRRAQNVGHASSLLRFIGPLNPLEVLEAGDEAALIILAVGFSIVGVSLGAFGLYCYCAGYIRGLGIGEWWSAVRDRWQSRMESEYLTISLSAE
jgi:hypothetical protein